MTTRHYGQYCPVARSLDVLGERWTLLIVRDLLAGPLRFSDLRRSLGGIGPNLLTVRLRRLEEQGIVRRRDLPPPAARTVYELTDRGRRLEPLVLELGRWGLDLLGRPPADDGPASHVVPTAVKAMIRADRLPAEGLRARLELDRGDLRLEVAPRPPDAEGAGGPGRRVTVATAADPPAAREQVDVRLQGRLGHLVRVRQGSLAWPDAEQRGLAIHGSPAAASALRRLFDPGMDLDQR